MAEPARRPDTYVERSTELRPVDTYVERRTDDGAGMASGMVLGIVVILLVAIVALFFVFGGPSRFAGNSATPNQTNVNVPSQQQPNPQNNSAPNINVPRQIDVNINQPPAQQQPAQQQPAQQQPAQQAPNR